jgi:hypothetical protein
MVHVTNRSYVHMRFGALKLTLGHGQLLNKNSIDKKILVPMTRIERVTSPLPRECSTTEPHGR